MSEDTRLYSCEFVAARYGVTVATLRNWRYHGKGPKFVRLENSNRIFYRMTDLLAYEAKNVRSHSQER